MQKQAPSLGRIVVMVGFALSCFGLLLFLWLAFGGAVPLKPKGYRFTVPFREAGQLAQEADVRISGVTVGKVKVIKTDKGTGSSDATIELQPQYAPIPKDSRAILRQKTLLGETYVELTPGSQSSGDVPDNGRLQAGQVAPTVELDEIFRGFDAKTRAAFQVWMQQLALASQGRGRDISDTLGNLAPFAEDTTTLLKILNAQDANVQGVVRDTGAVFDALSERDGQLRALIENSNRVFETTARRNRELEEAFRALPTFERESATTIARLTRFAHDTNPLVTQLRPAARELSPTLQELGALAPDLKGLFENLNPLIDASKTGLPATTQTLEGVKPMLAELQPFLEQLNPVLQWLEYHQLDTADFISNGASTLADTVPTSTPNEVGHYLRQFGPVGPESVGMYPNRPAASRGNAYLNPGALSGEKRAREMIFPNFDCDNAGGERITQVPDTSDAPSCFVQDPPAWPPGNKLRYPHIDKADYSK